MKKYIIILALILTSYQVKSQNINLNWVKSNYGIQGSSISRSVATSTSGDVYNIGRFSGSVDFNPALALYYILNASYTGESSYIQKLNNNGNLVWVKAVDFVHGGFNKIKTDPFDNLIIIGNFKDSVDIDPGTGVHMLYSNGGYDAFILKLSANGNFIWAKSFGGSEVDAVIDLAVDNKGNIYTHGQYQDTVDFDPGPGSCFYGAPYTIFYPPPMPLDNAFIQKLDKNGNFVWAKAFLNNEWGGGSHGICIDTDADGNIFCAGDFDGIGIDFDPGPGQCSAPTNYSYMYLVKLDSMGSFIWASFNTYINGWGNSYVKSIKTDRYDNIYATGIFGGYVDFDPGADTLLLSGSASGNFMPFIQKFDKYGKFLWAKSYGRGNNTTPTSLATDTFGNIYSTGFFYDSTNLAPWPDTLIFYTNSYRGGYLQKLNANGNLVWAGILQGNSGSSNSQDIFVNNADDIFLSGEYTGTVDFDIGPGVHNVTNYGAAFILKLSQCKTLTTDYITTCDSITWMDSVTYYHSTQSAYFTLPSSTGCDSVICLSLTIPNIDTTVSVSTTGLFSANQSLASYQWLDCNNGLAALTGDTLQTFTPTTNGSYAVAINVSGCVDTSACIPISNVSIEEMEGLSIKLYPNPNTGSFVLDLGTMQATEVRIVNSMGQQVFKTSNVKNRHFNLDLKPGIYFMEIRSENASKTIKFVVN